MPPDAARADRWICSPYFIAVPEPGLADGAAPQWIVNSPELSGDDPMARMGVLYGELATRVAAALAAGERPVSLAGDCLSSLGMVAGLQRAGIDASLLWFDAHGDFNTPETSPSGFLGGMPLAMAAGRGDLRLIEALGVRPIDEERITLSDARDLDPGEREAVAGSGMTHIGDVADLLALPLPDGPLYVHFDTDIVDATESPAQNYPVTGGPSAALMAQVFRRLARSASVVAVSVSAWNPRLAGGVESRRISMALIETLLGTG